LLLEQTPATAGIRFLMAAGANSCNGRHKIPRGCWS